MLVLSFILDVTPKWFINELFCISHFGNCETSVAQTKQKKKKNKRKRRGKVNPQKQDIVWL